MMLNIYSKGLKEYSQLLRVITTRKRTGMGWGHRQGKSLLFRVFV